MRKYITTPDYGIKFSSPVLGFDVETDGLNTRTNNLLLIQLSDGALTYIFDARVLPSNYIREVFARLDDCTFIAHNAKFDVGFIFAKYGIIPSKIHDTMITEAVLNSGRETLYPSLKNMAAKRLGIEVDKSLQSSFLTPTRVLSEEQLDYAAEDAEILVSIYYQQIKEVSEGGFKAVVDLENALIPVVMKMEHYGITFDTEKLLPVLESNEQKAKEFEQELFKIAGKEFNPRSPKQVKEIFHALAGSTGNKKLLVPSTGIDVLRSIRHPFPRALLEYRKYQKLVSTYGIKLVEKIEEDGKIHCTFNQLGTQCITGGNLLLTSTGFKRMDRLVKYTISGQFVPFEDHIVNKNRRLETSSYAVKYEDQPTIRVTLQNGMIIEGTYNHPVMSSCITYNDILRNHSEKQYKRISSRKSFKQLSNLAIGNYIEIPLGTEVFNTVYQPVTYEDVSIYRSRTEIKIPEIFDEDFAEFVGMYYADGTIRDEDGTFEIRIHNKDKDVEIRFKELVHNLFGDIKVTVEPETAGSIRYTIRSIKLKGLSKYFPRGCYNKIIPEELLNSPRGVIAAFIRGVTLDSSIFADRNTLLLTQAIEENVVFIQNALLNMGIACTIRKERGHGRIRRDFYRLGIRNEFYERFLTEVGIIQTRKIKKIKPRKNKKGYLILNNSWWSPVVDIEYTTNDVYDIHVPETHSFIANGIVNHNTGRFSSARPNLQNIPHQVEFRHLFVASEGYKFVTCDYSQIELRLAGILSSEPKILAEYMKPDADLHRLTAANIFRIPPEEITKEQRSAGKIGNFSALYGTSAKSMSIKQEISYSAAQAIIDGFWGGYPVLHKYMLMKSDEAVKNGFARTPTGRIRYLDIPSTSDPGFKYKLAAIKREGFNMDIQGFAADIMKYALVMLDKALGDSGRIVLTVHDEAGIEVEADRSHELAHLIQESMESSAKILVNDILPMKAEPVLMDSWTK